MRNNIEMDEDISAYKKLAGMSDMQINALANYYSIDVKLTRNQKVSEILKLKFGTTRYRVLSDIDHFARQNG